jgi:hypothetical protein
MAALLGKGQSKINYERHIPFGDVLHIANGRSQNPYTEIEKDFVFFGLDALSRIDRKAYGLESDIGKTWIDIEVSIDATPVDLSGNLYDTVLDDIVELINAYWKRWPIRLSFYQEAYDQFLRQEWGVDDYNC